MVEEEEVCSLQEIVQCICHSVCLILIMLALLLSNKNLCVIGIGIVLIPYITNFIPIFKGKFIRQYYDDNDIIK